MNLCWKRLLSAIFVLILLVLSVPFAGEHVSAAATTAPTLYCNDEVWYKDSELPLVRLHQAYLVPVSIFGMIEGFEVTVDRQRGQFMIVDRIGGGYMSFNHNDSYAITDDGKEFYFKSYQMYTSEYYVSAQTVCQYMGLECEIYTSEYDGSVSLRISDPSTAIKTIEELLYHYNPAALGIEQGSDDKKVEPYAKGKSIYLTFNGISARYMEEVLTGLKRYNMKATFFLTAEEILENPKTVIRLYSEGHAIGIYVETVFTDSELDFNVLMEELGCANQALFQLLKIKTRLVRLDLAEVDTARVFAGVHYENLKYCGYVLWNYNNSSYQYEYTYESVLADIVSTVEGRAVPAVYIPYTEICVAAFLDAMQLLYATGDYSAIPASASVTEYNYIDKVQ